MNITAKAMIIGLATSFCTYAQTTGYGWKSYINGKAYETNATPDELIMPSKTVAVQISKNVGGDIEPIGKCSIMEAIKLADLEAGRLIGTEYSGADPSWILDKAERVRVPISGVYQGCYYLISYREVIPRKATLPLGSLQVVVLLDSKVLPITPVEQVGAGQPATRTESKSQGSDKPQPGAEGRSR